MIRTHQHRGFTLIEMMVVIIIIAIAVSGVAIGIGTSSRSQLRSSTMMIVSASKYAFSRSVSKGTTVRLVINMDDGTLQIQETSGRVVLNRQDETGEGMKRQDIDEEVDEDGNVVDGSISGQISSIGPDLGVSGSGNLSSGGANNPMMQMMGGMGGGFSDPYFQSLQQGAAGGGSVRYHGPTFEVIDASIGTERKLKGKSRVQRVFSPHAPQAIESGNAFVYFFPGGTTEHTFIQLTDDDEDRPLIFTVEIHPLTGRAIVHQDEREPTGDLEELEEVK